jgi:polysaccharide biosynthesis protein PslG
MRRSTVAIAVALVAVLGASAVATTAGAANRMWVGFHDDPSFRWASDRSERIQASADVGASVMRLLVHWNQVAPQRPARPADPFDPSYNFGDVDEAIRTARNANLQVLVTLYGTPRWANGGRGASFVPTRFHDFKRFAQAIASRYSGRHADHPQVRFWSVWNEPNLQRFLRPQFDKRGKPLAPKNYAALYAAAYQGIKTGNPAAKVAIGETSPRGSDKAKGIRAIHSPGKFAEMVAKANRRLKFDAWAHHPYPSVPGLKPSHKVRWPNVTLSSLPEFQKRLRKWFKRSKVDIWITEYAHQTRPQDRLGVTYKKQAEYIRQAMSIARKQPFTKMFVWFVFRDDPGQEWESGIYTRAGLAKGGAPAAFTRAARPVDPR